MRSPRARFNRCAEVDFGAVPALLAQARAAASELFDALGSDWLLLGCELVFAILALESEPADPRL